MSAFTRPGSEHVHTKLSHKEYIDPLAFAHTRLYSTLELMPPHWARARAQKARAFRIARARALAKHILVNLPPKAPRDIQYCYFYSPMVSFWALA